MGRRYYPAQLGEEGAKGPHTNTDSLNLHLLRQRLASCKSVMSNKFITKRKQPVKQFFATTTFHGLYLAYNSQSKFGKCFWVLVLLCGFGFVSFQILELLLSYLKYPTVTSVDMVYPSAGIQLPNFTICILNRVNETALKQLYPEVDANMSEFLSGTFLSAYSTTIINMEQLPFDEAKGEFLDMERKTSRFLQSHNLTILGLFEAISHRCEDLFKGCWFQNGEIVDCCTLMTRFLSHNGPCFAFSLNKSFTQVLPGPVGGLGFIYWHPTEHLSSTVFNSYEEDAVHMFPNPIDSMLGTNPTAISIGSHAHILIDASHTSRVRKSNMSKCGDKVVLKYFKSYGHSECQLDCMIEQFMTNCNCTGLDTYVPMNPQNICSPYQALVCYQTVMNNMSSLLSICRHDKCPEACDFWHYRASVTNGKVLQAKLMSKIPTYWKDVPKGEKLDKHLIIADIYYADIKYMEVREMYSITIETFMSNIGGALGFWTGASIITLIHLFYHFICATFGRDNEVLQRSTRSDRTSPPLASTRRRLTIERSVQTQSNELILKFENDSATLV